ncbi:phytanoyl-CoA dioxygenase: peroxisomal-like protein, partial [Dinothrombium tinctorium]
PKFEYTLDNSKLTIEQRTEYENNGFLVIRNMLSKEECEKYSQRFRDIANGKVKAPGMIIQKDISFVKEQRNENTVYKLQELFCDEVLFEYCKHNAILEYAECFAGPNLMAIHTMLINKPPDLGTKSSRHPLHQDLHYFPLRPANRIVCAWTALERVTRENGCLVAIPGTHKGELLEHDYPDWEGGVNKMYHGVKQMSKEVERVYLEMEGGDTVLFHPLLIHGSGANRTKGYRKAISCHYAASECHYIDIKGTSQEKIAEEVLEILKEKYGTDFEVDYATVWKYRAQLVKGERINV